MTLEITTTPVNVAIGGGATLSGRRWIVSPLMPWSGDVSIEALDYAARNTGKTRNVDAFLGVRYAQPPTGSRRWKAAEAYTYAAGTHDLDTWGNVPIMTGGIENETTGRPETGPTVGAQNWRGLGTQESEDCLTLNIWRPDGTPPAGGWPVVVWVHGGGWTQNSALQPQWRGHRLCTKGLIVVTVEYRLSSFGHFWHADWEAEPGWDTPSFAMTDVRMALQWVQDNIGFFSGNTAKVMLGGSSAGAECVLALQEDATASSLFSCSWAVSGGGIGDRDTKAASTTFEGYQAFYERLHKVITKAAPKMRDYANPARTVADAIAADGMGSALRNALSPAAILALLDRRNTITRASFESGSLSFSTQSSLNRYPWFGGQIVYPNSIAAAKDGAYVKPLIVSSAQNEGNAGGSAAITGLIRRLNVFDEAEWMRQAYTDVAWTADFRQDMAYSHSTFQYPAWRIARGMYQTASSTPYLVLWNFTGSAGGSAGHSSELPFMFGNVQWGCPRTGGADGENQVTARALLMAEGMMQIVANFANSANPNTLYSHATDFDLFATDPGFSLTSYSTALPERWNIIGKNGLNASAAPVQCVHEDYFAGAWLDYLNRLE